MLVSSVCPSPFILTARPVLAFNSPFLLAEISSVNWIFETDLSFIAAIYSSQLPTCLAWLWEVLASFLVSSFVELETLLGFVPYVLVESFESALLCGLSEEVSSLLVANKDFGACTSEVSCSDWFSSTVFSSGAVVDLEACVSGVTCSVDLFASSASSFALFISLEFSMLCSDWFSSTVFFSGAVVDLEACVSGVTCSVDLFASSVSSFSLFISLEFSVLCSDWFSLTAFPSGAVVDLEACVSGVTCSVDLFASSVSSFSLFISLEFSVLCSDWFSSTAFPSGAVVDLEACVSEVSCSGAFVNSLASSAFWLVSTLFSLDWFTNSSAFASFPIPKNNVAPTRIEAVPTVNLLIEYLFCLFGIKSNLFFNTFTPR